MRKIVKVGICTMTAVMLLTGCTGKDKAGETTAVETGTSAAGAEGTTPEETEAFVAESSITLGEYKGIPVSVAEATVTEDELEAQIQQILNARAEYVEVDRAAKDGDTVNIDYVGLLDGKAFEGGTAEKSDLVLGSDSFIDGFEAGLVGTKKGDKKDLDLTFPEGYSNAELSGKAVVFQVTVNAVKERTVPELNDGFVLKNSPEDLNVENYKKRLREDIMKQKQYQIENQRNFEIVDAISANSEIVCATADVDKEYEIQLQMYTSEAQAYGMDFATYASMYGMDENGFKSEIRNMSKEGVKQRMIFAEVAKKENITVTDEDRNALAEANKAKDAAALIEQYGEEEVEKAALSKKVIDFLVENAAITVTQETAAEETTVEETTAK